MPLFQFEEEKKSVECANCHRYIHIILLRICDRFIELHTIYLCRIVLWFLFNLFFFTKLHNFFFIFLTFFSSFSVVCWPQILKTTCTFNINLVYMLYHSKNLLFVDCKISINQKSCVYTNEGRKSLDRLPNRHRMLCSSS